MPPSLGQWIHSFAVTETQTHKRGYTIYKITSIVFPRAVPQALTALTVWRRFHDVKRLHRELARRHRSLHLSGRLPEPTDCSYFKRFHPDVIRRRKDYILQLLDFVAQHPALYKCHAFAQFFSDDAAASLTPSPLRVCGSGTGSGGAIADICEELDLRRDDDFPLLDPQCDKHLTNSDKNVTPLDKQEMQEEKVASEGSSKPNRDYSRFLTPMASIESDDSDYIYEAALEFSRAVQAEANLEYKEAYLRYKRGVEALLNGAKEDGNEERKYIAKTKISKYLTRADDIHEKFLLEEQRVSPRLQFQLAVDAPEGEAGHSVALFLERPWNHLAKYKVLQVLGGSVIQVQCVTEPLGGLVMKGIEKPPSRSPTQSIFLPQNVPYMVELLAFFQSEHKVFLLLRQAEGGRLYDYVRSYTPTAPRRDHFVGLFPEVAVVAVDGGKHPLPSKTADCAEIVRVSQELLQSVSNTLRHVQALEVDSSRLARNEDNAVKEREKKIESCQKIPEASLKQWARELAVSIRSLHSKGVILGDLHMENLLLGAKGQLLLSYFYQHESFEASLDYVHKSYSWRAVQGHFVAPERPLTLKSDWWSYGVVLYQLVVGMPFVVLHPGHVDIYGCVQYPEDLTISECARDLLENLLKSSAELRFDWEQLQRHAFFAGTDWAAVERQGLNTPAGEGK